MYWSLLLLLLPIPTLAEHTDTVFNLTSIQPTHEAVLLARRDLPTSFTSHIIPRELWGADESFLFQSEKKSVTKRTRAVARREPSDREQECDALQKDFKEEFTAAHTITHDLQGRRYRWAPQYSKDVRLLVVHHTALEVNGDTRTEEERVRALYAYHANSLGWGDIGYNFVIGESGRVYEGRTGGDFVIGGHAYCYNIGSLGIALLGNFEQEYPTQQQIQGLQWLLDYLAKKYGINPSGRVAFHGKTLPTIVGHNDLNSTACPGYFLDGVLPQIRAHVSQGNLTAAVTFPTIRIAKNIIKQVSMRKNERQGIMQQSPIPTQYSRRTARSRRIVARAVERVTRGPKKMQSSPANKDSVPTIRIRLSYAVQAATIAAPDIGEVTLRKTGDRCNIHRIESTTGILTITSWTRAANQFRGNIECRIIDGKLTLINELPLEDYLRGLSEEPDSEPYEKQRAFAIAARSYAAHYMDSRNRKFPGLPYDGSDDPAEFQAYGGVAFERANPQWVTAAKNTTNKILTKNGHTVKAAYFSTDDGRTRSPAERGWKNFPFAEVFTSKPDPWCKGLPLNGHGVGMSGCGAGGQAREGKRAEEILQYYYPGTLITPLFIAR